MITTGAFTTDVDDLSITEVITMLVPVSTNVAYVTTDVYVADRLTGLGGLLSSTKNRVTEGNERMVTPNTAQVIAASWTRTRLA